MTGEPDPTAEQPPHISLAQTVNPPLDPADPGHAEYIAAREAEVARLAAQTAAIEPPTPHWTDGEGRVAPVPEGPPAEDGVVTTEGIRRKADAIRRQLDELDAWAAGFDDPADPDPSGGDGAVAHQQDDRADDDDHKVAPSERDHRKTQAERLGEAVAGAGAVLFHDPEHRAFATFEIDGHRETWPLRSAGFRRFLSWRYYTQNKSVPRAADVADFLATLEGKAQFDGPMERAHVRIAPTDGGLALDLGDADWSVIEVDAHGWRHVVRPSVRFVRPRGLQALPVPVRGGTVKRLRPYVNVSDDDAWRLVIGFVIMMFRPQGPYPVLALHGEQGSAKSTAMRILRRLVDPRESPDRSAPRDDRDLAVHALHNWVIALDNVSMIPGWLSDALARIATGSGFSTRQLYTDADEFSFSAARPIMLNGIGEVIERSDLLDRALIVKLPPIAESQRRLEAEFWAAFEADRPAILGALLDAVGSAIARESGITMARWPRLADFARWVTAAEPALGWRPGSFLASYFANRGAAHELVLEADPVATAVRDLLATRETWEGRASDLLATLAGPAGETVTRRKDWPAAAHVLSNRLERLAPNLRAIGIEVSRGRTEARRTISLRKVDRARDGASSASAASAAPLPSVADDARHDAPDDGHDARAGRFHAQPDAPDAPDAGLRPSDDGTPACPTCSMTMVIVPNTGQPVCTNPSGHGRKVRTCPACHRQHRAGTTCASADPDLGTAPLPTDDGPPPSPVPHGPPPEPAAGQPRDGDHDPGPPRSARDGWPEDGPPLHWERFGWPAGGGVA